MKRFRASALVAAALAVAVAAESASAEVITPQVVEPSVVTPHAVAPTPAAPATTTAAPAPAPQATSAPSSSSEQAATPQPPSPQPSSNTNRGGQVAGGSGSVSGSPSSSGYDRGQADSVADFALAIYNVELFWQKSDYGPTPRSELSLEGSWTLAVQIVDAVHDAVESGNDPDLPTWPLAPREGPIADVDPPYDKQLDWDTPIAPDPSPTPGTDAGTPGDTANDSGAGDTAEPADGGAGGKPVDDDVPKSEE